MTHHPLDDPIPAGATFAGLEPSETAATLPLRLMAGRARRPVPLGCPAGGGDECRRSAPFESAAAERERDELAAFAGLHPHQNRALIARTRAGDFRAHVGRSGNFLASDFEDYIAGRKSVISGNARRIDLGDNTAIYDPI